MNENEIEWVGIRRGADVLNYRGPCKHEWEQVTFVPESEPERSAG